MELILKDKVFNMSSNSPVKEIMDKINMTLSKSEYISHLVVDGREIFLETESETPLVNEIGKIRKIEVIVNSSEKIVSEVLSTMHTYILNAKPEMILLAEKFYNIPNKLDWTKFMDMLEGAQWIYQTATLIKKIDFSNSNIVEVFLLTDLLSEELANLHNAMTNEDNILIGDIIKYELHLIYEKIQYIIETLAEDKEI